MRPTLEIENVRSNVSGRVHGVKRCDAVHRATEDEQGNSIEARMLADPCNGLLRTLCEHERKHDK